MLLDCGDLCELFQVERADREKSCLKKKSRLLHWLQKHLKCGWKREQQQKPHKAQCTWVKGSHKKTKGL